MKRPFFKLLLLAPILAAQAASAQQPGDTGDARAARDDETIAGMARVVSQHERLAPCLAPVVISSVDGEKLGATPREIFVEPGIHSLNGRVTLDLGKCGARERYAQIRTTDDLVALFEAGKSYHVAYDLGAGDAAEWKLVVFRVDQAPPAGDGGDAGATPVPENTR